MNFDDFAYCNGLLISKLSPSDAIQRCPTVDHPKPSSTNGAFFWDGRRGWVFCWDGEQRIIWFGGDDVWTEQDKQEWKRRQEAAKRERLRANEAAAKLAGEMIRRSEIREHPYLTSNKLDEPGYCLDQTLLVPMRDHKSNSLLGVQRIFLEKNKWVKKMLSGQRAKGASLQLGPKKANEKILCEGYATGLSIRKAADQLGFAIIIVICFSSGNLVEIAKMTPGKVMVYADNDRSCTGEQAAQATGCPYVMSHTEGNDANDDHQMHGIGYVRQQILKVRKA